MLSSRPTVLQDRYEEVPIRAFASKTPGRHVLPSTAGLKSALRKENSKAPKSTLARSKATINLLKEAIEPKRLFKDATAKPQGKGLADVTNKTPAPSKVNHAFKTPLPGTSKGVKLAPLLSGDAEPADPTPGPNLEPPPTALRPSASRRSSRVPRSASKSFETPAPGLRKHWEVSEGDISVGVLSELSLKEADIEEEDDEVEYMPAVTPYVEQYHPGFDLPDLRELGQRIMKLSQLPDFYDDVPLDETMFDLSPGALPPAEKFRLVGTRQLEDDDLFGPPVELPAVLPNTDSVRPGPVVRKGLAAPARPATARPGPPSTAASNHTARTPASRPPPSRQLPKTGSRPASTLSTTRAPPSSHAARAPSALTSSSANTARSKKPLLAAKPIAERKNEAKIQDTLDAFLAPEMPSDELFLFDV